MSVGHASCGGRRSLPPRSHRRPSVLELPSVLICEPADCMTHYDLIIRGGRVLDPETQLDVTADVAVKDGAIAAVGDVAGAADKVIDACGLAVVPGFIDLHAHGQSLPADRMQAFDGVTTTLELEIGVMPVARWY